MAEARVQHDWNQTASLLALIAECHRDPERRRRPYKPAEFHPLTARRRRRRGLTGEEMTRQMEAFAGKRFDREPGTFETIFGRK